MGRPLRIEFEGALYHITARGNAKEDIFLSGADRRRFMEILKDYHEKLDATYHCFVLMNNHYHLLLETPRGNLISIMHGINTSYTGYFNRRYERVGHLFQGRYKAVIVEKESHLLEVSRYIHLNPIRAGICNRPEDYPWSSFKGYLHPKNRLEWVEYDWTLGQFGRDLKESSTNYKVFVEEGLLKKLDSPLQDAVGGVLLGSKNFTEKLTPYFKKRLNDQEIARRRELEKYVPSKKIIDIVARFYGVSMERLIRRRRGNLPKKVALFLLHKKSGLSNREIACLFEGLHYSTVSQTVRRLKNELIGNESLAKEVSAIEGLLLDLSNVKT